MVLLEARCPKFLNICKHSDLCQTPHIATYDQSLNCLPVGFVWLNFSKNTAKKTTIGHRFIQLISMRKSPRLKVFSFRTKPSLSLCSING